MSLILEPEPPKDIPEVGVLVLGRFQPFHKGHESLVKGASEVASDSRLVIGVGSSNREESLENPWSWQERIEMISVWLAAEGIEAEVVAIPDIEDPPNWVAHASRYHGELGVIYTSDEGTAELYRDAGWEVIDHPLVERDDLQGWRIRLTLKMLSTVHEREGCLQVMSVTIPDVVAEHLYDGGLLARLAFLGADFGPVG